MARILIVGGLGVVGRILCDNLSGHEITIADIVDEPEDFKKRYVRLDISDYDDLCEKVNGEYDVVINLVALREMDEMVEPSVFNQMSRVYVQGSYNILYLAKERNIPKVIMASSNHVTGYYEKDGRSLLGREIEADD